MTDEWEMRERARQSLDEQEKDNLRPLVPPYAREEVIHVMAVFAAAERDLFTKILDLVATDELFIQPAEGGGWVFWVNVNDMFYPASDGEGIDISEIPALWQTWKEKGWPGVVRWVQGKRDGLKLRKSREETICNIEALQKQVTQLAAERDAERECCCLDVCPYCRNTSSWNPATLLIDGLWEHEHKEYAILKTCKAAAIRSRVAAQGEKNANLDCGADPEESAA